MTVNNEDILRGFLLNRKSLSGGSCRRCVYGLLDARLALGTTLKLESPILGPPVENAAILAAKRMLSTRFSPRAYQATRFDGFLELFYRAFEC